MKPSSNAYRLPAVDRESENGAVNPVTLQRQKPSREVSLDTAFLRAVGLGKRVRSPEGELVILADVDLSVAAGDKVTTAMASALELRTSDSLTGGGAFLDRMVPAVYAAPVFYYFLHYLT